MPRPNDLRAWKERWGFKGGVRHERSAFGTSDTFARPDARTAPFDVPIDRSKGRKRAVDDSFLEFGTEAERERRKQELLANRLAIVPSQVGQLDADERTNPTDETAAGPEIGDDGTDAYDALGGDFAQALMARLGGRWGIDRTAQVDQITGVAYSKQRRNELEATVGNHYLVAEYGMRTIKEKTRFDARTGIRIEHETSSTYLRDAPDEGVEGVFAQLYEKARQTTPTLPDAAKVVFVNSPAVPEKLTAIYGSEWEQPTPEPNQTAAKVLPTWTKKTQQHKAKPIIEQKQACPWVIGIAPGVHAMFFAKEPQNGVTAPPSADQILDMPTGNAFKALKEQLLVGVGAMPSSYQAVKALEAPNAVAPLDDPALQAAEPLGNAAALDSAVKSKGRQTLAGLPDDHAMKTIGQASAKLVSGLQDALGKLSDQDKEKFEKNKLIQSALHNIGQMMEVMPTYIDDIPRFSRLFDVLVDEVYLVLATAKPYKPEDFQTSAKTMMEKRAPTLGEIPGVSNDTFLLANGMDTIASAITAAKGVTGADLKVNLIEATGNPKSRGANYFEVQQNLLGPKAISNDGRLVMGTLNPSTPTQKMNSQPNDEWNVGKLIAEIQGKTQTATPEEPAVVVLDITVEKEPSLGEKPEVDQIVAAFKTQIADGSVQLVLSKSYQKFPSLGSGKVMSGGVTVIGTGSTADTLKQSLGKAQTDSGCMGNDETQMVSLFMEHEEAMERPMLDRAAKNAKFVKDLMPANLPDAPGKPNWFAEGLPFVVVDDTPIAPSTGGSVPPQILLYEMGVDMRFSFGFQNSSALTLPGGVRIATGQETQGELAEKFYAFGKMITPPRQPVAPTDLAGFANQASADAMQELLPRLAKPPKTGFSNDNDKESRAWRSGMAEDLLAAGVLAPAQIEWDADRVPTSLLGHDSPGRIDQDIAKLTGLLGSAAEDAEAQMAQALGRSFKPGEFMAMRLAFIGRHTATLPERDEQNPKESERDRVKDPLNVNTLATRSSRGWKAPDGGKPVPQTATSATLPNRIASCALATSALFKRNEDLPAFTALADPLIANSLGEVSPEARQRLLGKRAEAVIRLAKAPAQQTSPQEAKRQAAEVMKDVARFVDMQPYREGGANLLTSDEVTEALEGDPALWTDDNCASLIGACTSKIGVKGDLELLASLVQSVAASNKEWNEKQAVLNGTKATQWHRTNYPAMIDGAKKREAQHKRLAKLCAKRLKDRLKDVGQAFDERLPATKRPAPPLAPAVIGKIPMGNARRDPPPMDKVTFTNIVKDFKKLQEDNKAILA